MFRLCISPIYTLVAGENGWRAWAGIAAWYASRKHGTQRSEDTQTASLSAVCVCRHIPSELKLHIVITRSQFVWDHLCPPFSPFSFFFCRVVYCSCRTEQRQLGYNAGVLFWSESAGDEPYCVFTWGCVWYVGHAQTAHEAFRLLLPPQTCPPLWAIGFLSFWFAFCYLRNFHFIWSFFLKVPWGRLLRSASLHSFFHLSHFSV